MCFVQMISDNKMEKKEYFCANFSCFFVLFFTNFVN